MFHEDFALETWGSMAEFPTSIDINAGGFIQLKKSL